MIGLPGWSLDMLKMGLLDCAEDLRCDLMQALGLVNNSTAFHHNMNSANSLIEIHNVQAKLRALCLAAYTDAVFAGE